MLGTVSDRPRTINIISCVLSPRPRTVVDVSCALLWRGVIGWFGCLVVGSGVFVSIAAAAVGKVSPLMEAKLL